MTKKYALESEWDDKATKNAMYYVHAATSTWKEEDFFKTGEDEIEQFKNSDYFRNVDCDLALDFGCGIGRLSFPLAKLFKKVISTDVSQVMIDKANQYKDKFKSNNVEFKKCNGVDSDIFEDNSFSFIYSDIALQHIENPARVEMRKELLRVLKPGCWAWIQDEVFKEYQDGWKAEMHKMGWSVVDITREAPDAKGIDSESVFVWLKK